MITKNNMYQLKYGIKATKDTLELALKQIIIFSAIEEAIK